MKAGTLGVLSAVFASACCGVPLLLAAVGLGGLGIGSFLGAYHWYFLGTGTALLALAWYVFLRERRRLYAAGIEVRHAGFTRGVLALATLAVIGFGAVNTYSALGLGAKAQEISLAAAAGEPETSQVVFRVEGMTCVSCEMTVEKALKRLDGVAVAKASASEGKVLVRYQPDQVSFDEMREAIDATGYKSRPPL